MSAQEAPRHLLLVYGRGLDQDVFAFINEEGMALLAGINHEDILDDTTMEVIKLGNETFYWGHLSGVKHRIQGALRDAAEERNDNSCVVMTHDCLEIPGKHPNRNIGRLLASEPEFLEFVRNQFNKRPARTMRRIAL